MTENQDTTTNATKKDPKSNMPPLASGNTDFLMVTDNCLFKAALAGVGGR